MQSKSKNFHRAKISSSAIETTKKVQIPQTLFLPR